MARSSLRERADECSVMSVCSELELRGIREENASLTVSVNEYTGRVEKIEKSVEGEELNWI